MNVQEARPPSAPASRNNNSEQLLSRSRSFVKRTAAVAARGATEAEAVDRDARFPQAAIDAARQQRLLGTQIPHRVRRRRRVDLRHHRHVLHAGPRLLVHRDDLCDASDQGRLPGPARRRQRLARNADAPRGDRTDAAGVIDHRRTERRKHPLQRGRGRMHAGAEISLVRNATVISYGAQADGIVTIARRANDAAALRPGAAGHHQGQLHAGAQP